MDANQLSDLYEIQKLKARYFRLMDTKQWDAWRDLFTDDMELFLENGALPEADTPTLSGADALVAYLSSSHPGKVTVHQGHMPEIELTSPTTATGIWALNDIVIWPDGTRLTGYGHYHETYEKISGDWKITSSKLTRLHTDIRAPESG